eukprot:TRINITY_DN1606_c1_g1_i1.p1 TRINITY_DN1606_c1_g1~~TRINITY_DN1606_c1_g1_i1.p1  ORF type:complete len:919 (+),score=171.81 TRINITY_DN1606_c1_g1_i1:37-2757(+)
MDSPQAEMEKKRSVPKKGVVKQLPGQTTTTSLLPYSKASIKSAWSNGDFGGASMMGSIILKFGGSSCGGKLGQVLKLIDKHAREGCVAVVVSAMGKSTDLLIDAADKACLDQIEESNAKVDDIQNIAHSNIKEHCPEKGLQSEIIQSVDKLISELRQLLLGISLVRELSPATLDRLLSFGERLSSVVIASLLQASGTPAHPVDGKDWVVTNDEHGKAQVDWSETQTKLTALSQTWQESSVPVVTGFLGATLSGKRTTLGRNGSDYTAALLGQGIGACRVIINTDVPGVFTADPGIVKEAYPVPELSYVEAMELSIYGSRMFHPRTILPLVEQRIPMVIRNTDDPEGKATTIMDSTSLSQMSATCVTQLEGMAVIDLRSRLGQETSASSSGMQHIGIRLTSCLGSSNIRIHHASFAANGQAVHIVIHRDHVPEAKRVMVTEFEREMRKHELEEMNIWEPVTLLSLVRAPQSVLPKVLSALTVARVKVRSISQGSNSSCVSFIVDSHDTAVAVRCAHTSINLGHQIVSLVILGSNANSLGLLERLLTKRQEYLSRYKVEFRVVGTFHTCGRSSDYSLVEQGVDIESIVAQMKDPSKRCNENPAGKRMSAVIPVRVLQRLRQMPCPIVVDCNRLEIEGSEFYKTCFQLGIHVVVSNAASVTRLSRVITNHELITFDNCVGASVPICDSIRMTNQMGDRVSSIEASLSGTCGYVALSLSEGAHLSDAVYTAITNSYAEPHIEVDLSGLDVARKLIVIARQMGLELSFDNIKTTPLVSEECLAVMRETLSAGEASDADAETLRQALVPLDSSVQESLSNDRPPGTTLAYIASIDFTTDPPKASVGPQFVSARHPAYSLNGTDIYALIRRCGADSAPLLVQGAGCGSMSALGIVGDILKTAQKLQGSGSISS